jgi:hypothetical protein
MRRLAADPDVRLLRVCNTQVCHASLLRVSNTGATRKYPTRPLLSFSSQGPQSCCRHGVLVGGMLQACMLQACLSACLSEARRSCCLSGAPEASADARAHMAQDLGYPGEHEHYLRPAVRVNLVVSSPAAEYMGVSGHVCQLLLVLRSPATAPSCACALFHTRFNTCPLASTLPRPLASLPLPACHHITSHLP